MLLRARRPGSGGCDLSETPRPRAAGTQASGSGTWRVGCRRWGLGRRTPPAAPARQPLPGRPGPSAGPPAVPRPPCADFCAASPPDHFPNSVCRKRVPAARPQPELPDLPFSTVPQTPPRRAPLTIKDPLGRQRGLGVDPQLYPPHQPPSTAFDS